MINEWYSLIIADKGPGNDKMLEIIIDILDDSYQNNKIICSKIVDIVSGTLYYHGYYHDNIMIKQW